MGDWTKPEPHSLAAFCLTQIGRLPPLTSLTLLVLHLPSQRLALEFIPRRLHEQEPKLRRGLFAIVGGRSGLGSQFQGQGLSLTCGSRFVGGVRAAPSWRCGRSDASDLPEIAVNKQHPCRNGSLSVLVRERHLAVVPLSLLK